MVTANGRNRTRQFDKKILPSGLFLEFLYEDNKDVEALKKEIESHKSASNSGLISSIIEKKDKKFIEKIKESFTDEDKIKCCRDINYYFDLLNAIIKKSIVFSKKIQNDLLGKFEERWNKILQEKDIGICTRETDLDSIRKRCILKHLHDLKVDKDLIQVYTDEYKTYLGDIWSKIIYYTCPQLGGLYIKIENDSVGIIEEYTTFLYSLDYICDVDLSKLSTDDITISTDMDTLMNNISLERISPNNNKKACYNNVYIDMLKNKTSNIKKINNVLSLGIALLGFSLILILIYKFSPLGSLLRRYTKKKIEVDENMNEEEMSELYNNSENEKPYISYYSVSH
ncbi:PIR Superfamily Protein [Plasmodium ovale curtisi]|uniref:PIR Superfamily Protein n=1 Tax=Plasmodium ovale curtisi TaxID=864141 RepID=A0A1A8XC37_PLAOA|nr:PIR Superfamily Protein [Plasmodium ovale curtisi]